jgi:hypothetical protein
MYYNIAISDTSQFLFNSGTDSDSEVAVQQTRVHNLQGSAMGSDNFTVLKATREIESLMGATEICDSRCRNDKICFLVNGKICAVAGMDGVTMRAVGSLCFYISFHQ